MPKAIAVSPSELRRLIREELERSATPRSEPKYLTFTEAAKIIRVHRVTVHKLCASGLLQKVLVAGQPRVLASSIRPVNA